MKFYLYNSKSIIPQNIRVKEGNYTSLFSLVENCNLQNENIKGISIEKTGIKFYLK